jgi:arylsulfatase A
MNRIILILTILGLYTSVLGGEKQSTTPNILFIMADDLGIKDLGCYGSDYYLTPNLDKLASQGMRFTRAYAGCHVCSPTRASILTGRYPHSVHITDALPWDRLYENPKMVPPDHLKELPSNLPTFAKALSSAGYKTALFGKWHLGNEYQFFTQGKHKAYGFDEAFPSLSTERKRDKCVDDLTEHTLEFLEINKEGPFMLCLMHHTPHVPLACPPEDEALYDGVPKGRFQKNQKYAGMVSHLDQSIQRILDKLEVLGLNENTVVFFK